MATMTVEMEAWPAPKTIGAATQPLAVEAKLDLGYTAEAAVSSFYEAQRSRHQQERTRLQNSGAPANPTKWNKQEIYLNDGLFAAAHLASRRHLARHPKWLRGRHSLGSAALQDIVAVQHFVDMDLEDLCLPDQLKRSQDAFGGQAGHICQQMLLDAPRSRFIVEGEVFDFGQERAAASSARQPAGQESAAFAENEQTVQQFSERLLDAVQQCLGGNPPPVLLRAVTTAMSQSGMANVERACEFPQVVVSGGESTVLYELKALGRGSWDLRLSLHKYGFEQCIVYSMGDLSNDSFEPRPMNCSSKSSILKELVLRFSIMPRRSGEAAASGVPIDFQYEEENSSWFSFVQPRKESEGSSSSSGERLEADVQSLVKEFNIVDHRGKPLPGLGPAWPWGLVAAKGSLRLAAGLANYVCCNGLLSRCVGSCGLAVRHIAQATLRIFSRVFHARRTPKTANAPVLKPE